MLIYTVILICLQLFFVQSAFSYPEEIDAIKLLEILESHPADDYSLVFFYSPYCPYCKNLEPHFDPLSKLYNDSSVHIYRVNGLSNKETRKTFGLPHFPTVKLYNNGKEISVYNGARSTSGFIDFLVDKTNYKPTIQAENVVKIKRDDTMAEWFNLENRSKDIIIAFYTDYLANWNNPYNSFFEDLSNEIEMQDKIFVKIDVMDINVSEIVEKFSVSSYPTFFKIPKADSMGELYNIYRLEGNFGRDELLGFIKNEDATQQPIDFLKLHKEVEDKYSSLNEEIYDDDDDEDEDNDDHSLYKYREL